MVAREQQRLARLGGVAAMILRHGRPEAHVEHAVGFVEHEHLHAGSDARRLCSMRSSRRPGVATSTSTPLSRALAICGLYGHAADYGEDAVLRGLRRWRSHTSPICCGKLARGGDHQHERSLACPWHAQSLSMVGRRERGGLARAGLRGGDEVAAFEHLGDGLLLHRGGGCCSPAGRDGVQCLARKAEVVEMQSYRKVVSFPDRGRGVSARARVCDPNRSGGSASCTARSCRVFLSIGKLLCAAHAMSRARVWTAKEAAR